MHEYVRGNGHFHGKYAPAHVAWRQREDGGREAVSGVGDRAYVAVHKEPPVFVFW